MPAILAAYGSALGPFLTNGLSLFEVGVQSMGVEHSGKFSTVLQEGLLQSVSPRPGELSRSAHCLPGLSSSCRLIELCQQLGQVVILIRRALSDSQHPNLGPFFIHNMEINVRQKWADHTTLRRVPFTDL